MKILVGMSHPAHFHLFHHTMEILKRDNHTVSVVITPKDVLEDLLKASDINYIRLTERNDYSGVTGKLAKLLNTSVKLDKLVREYQPDLMIGSFTQMAWVGRIRKIPSFFFGEDDITYTFLQSLITYPFIKHIVAPLETKVGIFNYKTIAYNGTQKLACLHPIVFVPDASRIPGVDVNHPFSIIRIVNLNAYHDVARKGLNSDILRRIIQKAETIGPVYISSEKDLPEEFKNYRLPVAVSDIHHALAFATLFIGDSQSMAVEAAVLGTPALKCNDFAGKISILNMLENNYGLTFGFKSSEAAALLKKMDELIATTDLKSVFANRRNKMLQDTIDVSAFFAWLVGNYPQSISMIKENPDYQYKFR